MSYKTIVSGNDTQSNEKPTSRSFEELPAAAQRALQEAEERRAAAAAIAEYETKAAREIGGRGGKDPVRFGDWEIKGRAIDF